MDQTRSTGDIDKQLMKGNKEMMEFFMKLLPFITVVLSLVVALIGLVKALPDLGMPGISRVTSKLENLKKLESHLEHDNEATVRLRRLLTDEAMKTICRKTYVRQGMIRQAARQRLRLGYISSCLLGAEIGIGVVLGVLFCIHSQKDDNALSFVLLLAYFAVLLIAGLTAAAGDWIYARITLNRQFRLDTEGKTEASLLETMDESFARLEKYEKKTFPLKLIAGITWSLITSIPLTRTFIINNSIPVKLSNAIYLSYLSAAIIFFVVSCIMLHCYPSKNKNKKTEPMNKHGQNDDSDDENTRPSTGGQAGRRSRTTTADTSHTDGVHAQQTEVKKELSEFLKMLNLSENGRKTGNAVSSLSSEAAAEDPVIGKIKSPVSVVTVLGVILILGFASKIGSQLPWGSEWWTDKLTIFGIIASAGAAVASAGEGWMCKKYQAMIQLKIDALDIWEKYHTVDDDEKVAIGGRRTAYLLKKAYINTILWGLSGIAIVATLIATLSASV